MQRARTQLLHSAQRHPFFRPLAHIVSCQFQYGIIRPYREALATSVSGTFPRAADSIVAAKHLQGSTEKLFAPSVVR
jgi:hypothetical protein